MHCIKLIIISFHITATRFDVSTFQPSSSGGCSRVFCNDGTTDRSRNSPHFMEPGGSLPNSQEPATCPYPEPPQSRPCPHPTSWRFILILFPSMPGSSKWSPFLRSLHQNPVCTSLFPHTCYMPRPSHSSRFHYPNNIWWWLQVIKFLVM
jgi:hypothetical protein